MVQKKFWLLCFLIQFLVLITTNAKADQPLISFKFFPYTLYTNTVVQLPAYFIVNAKVGYTFIPHTFELGFYVFNMFNDIHHEYPYVYEPNNALTQTATFGGEEIGRMLLIYTNIYF